MVSVVITTVLMTVVGAMLLQAAARGQRRRVKPAARRYGPFILLCVATPLVLADGVRHLLQDQGAWLGCGHNDAHSRANSSDPFPRACLWSSSQYRCSVPCCVPTWLPVPSTDSFAWFPPTSDSWPQFATLRPDGTVFLPSSFDPSPAKEPFHLVTAPAVLLSSGLRASAPGPGRGPEGPRECPFGRNPSTGYCLFTDPSKAMEEQVASLAGGSCDCAVCVHDETMSNLSPMGVLFTICFTYLGFAALATAVLWNANIAGKVAKVRAEWRALRGHGGPGGDGA